MKREVLDTEMDLLDCDCLASNLLPRRSRSRDKRCQMDIRWGGMIVVWACLCGCLVNIHDLIKIKRIIYIWD
jgi:hypothetical protein